MKKVLILGAGLVSKPLVEYLLNHGIRVTIATRTKHKADDIIKGHPNGSAVKWSIDDLRTIEKFIAENDITVSLLPYNYHVDIAKICLHYRKSLVTTSYVQAGMLALDEDAKKCGVVLLNEIGLDPGIDHMSAMKIIDYIHGNKGHIEEFYSLCGALPAPEAANNPLKYKFSWSPKGVIKASLNSALYLKNREKVSIGSPDLFKDRFTYNFPGIGNLEVYPNRDSITYIDIYKIPETRTMYRGTFRYKGWCETLDAMKRLNMLDDNEINYEGKTYIEFLAERSGLNVENLRKDIVNIPGISKNSTIIEALDYLGFFNYDKLQYNMAAPLDITSDRMNNKLQFSSDERDMVLLLHIFLASYPNGKREVIKSSLVNFGSGSGNSATSRTVALPAAVAVRMIVENRISLKGVYRPVVPQIYEPVLSELKSLGIEMEEQFGLPENEMIIGPESLKKL